MPASRPMWAECPFFGFQHRGQMLHLIDPRQGEAPPRWALYEVDALPVLAPFAGDDIRADVDRVGARRGDLHHGTGSAFEVETPEVWHGEAHAAERVYLGLQCPGDAVEGDQRHDQRASAEPRLGSKAFARERLRGDRGRLCKSLQDCPAVWTFPQCRDGVGKALRRPRGASESTLRPRLRAARRRGLRREIWPPSLRCLRACSRAVGIRSAMSR
jgi:hypothetical protein